MAEVPKQFKDYLFKPGQSGNPSGRPHLTEEQKKAREVFQEAIAHLGTKTKKELEDIAKDPASPIAYAFEAKALLWFFDKGNPAIYKEIHDRTLGKSPEFFHIEVDPYAGWSVEQLESRIREITEEKNKLIRTPDIQS